MSGGMQPDRLVWLWHGLFAATLLIPTVFALAEADRLLTAALATAFGSWYWLMVARHADRWERPAPMALYWCGAIAFTVALAGQHPAYVMLLYSQYPLMFITLGWWSLVPIVVMTALVGWRTGAWDGGAGAVLGLITTAGLSAVIAMFVNATVKQSEQRREALEALAATRAELAATARHAGVLEERQRLAREIHDTVAQALTSVVTQLEAADQAIDEHPDEARRHLHIARRSAREGLTDIRRSVRELRPDLLEGTSFGEALERTCRRWSTETGILARLRTTGTAVPLHPDTENALLRTVQEALVNIAKHAAATRVTITLSYLGDTVSLDIDDDGVGFAGVARPRADGGFGLAGMRERIAAVGGELHIESAPRSGTTIAASVPV